MRTSEIKPGLAEQLVNRLARIGPRRKATRRGFLAGATLAGAALAVDPIGYLIRPQDAWASACGTDASCSAGYSAFCCSINHGHNTCPPNTFAGGWWKADRSSYCGGAARYYIDCNARPGHHFRCRCNQSNCDHRYVACNVFRYGQCNTQVHGVTAVVCRQISCRPPWELYPGHCGKSSATDNNTRGHTAPCLSKANTYPKLVTFPKAPNKLLAGQRLHANQRITSYDRHSTCVMWPGGDLVVRNEMGVVWSSGTAPAAKGGYAELRANGELVIVSRGGKLVWSSRSARTGHHRTYLCMHDSGQLDITFADKITWHTRTHTP